MVSIYGILHDYVVTVITTKMILFTSRATVRAGHKEQCVYICVCACMYLYMCTCIYIQSLVHKCKSNARQYSLSPFGSLQMVVWFKKKEQIRTAVMSTGVMLQVSTLHGIKHAFMWEGKRMKRRPIIKQTAACTTKKERSSLTPVEISLFIDEWLMSQGEGECLVTLLSGENTQSTHNNTVKTTLFSWRNTVYL